MPCSFFTCRAAVLAFFTFWCAAAIAENDPFAKARTEFVEAYARVDSQDASSVDSEALRSYPLYPYLQSARIRRALLNTTQPLDSVDQRAATFLAYYDREPVARELRRAWLDSLAERQQWALFLQNYREGSGDALRCASFSARIALNRTETLATDIAAQWLTPQGIPECDQAFEWLRARDGLPPSLVEKRVKLALTKGNAAFAREIITQLPASRSAPWLQWAGLLDNPRRGIDALIASPNTDLDPAAVLAGWTQLARKDRTSAIARFDMFVAARKLDQKAASPYALALALPLAWDRDPASITYFAKVSPTDFDDAALEWQARAGLWTGDWALVTRSIGAMSETTRQSARWRYWLARASDATQDKTAALAIYRLLLAEDNYYSAMAAARLDEPVVPHPQKLVRDRHAIREIEQLPAFVRAHELLRANLRREASNEWQFGFESLGEPARPQTIPIAVEWEWFDQAVTTATQLRVFNDYELLYPQPFDREVRAAAKLTDVEPHLIYGVLRQESLYRVDAMSGAGAYGLLQLLPSTARRTAQRWERPRPSPSDLFIPATNVTLGAGQLRILLDRFGGQTAVALAAYNAGPTAASRWLPSQAVDPDVWVENIPYNETRGYVQRVLWHTVVFAWLRSGRPQQTDAWLGRITPLGDSALLGTLDPEP
ncbi:MAG: transglycosylase SLT domain-containing protein [Povalibacter sp.]